jgi:hypothetical protein
MFPIDVLKLIDQRRILLCQPKYFPSAQGGIPLKNPIVAARLNGHLGVAMPLRSMIGAS